MCAQSTAPQQIKLADPAFVVQIDKHQMTASLARVEGRVWQSSPEAISSLIDSLLGLGLTDVDVESIPAAIGEVLQGIPFCFCRGIEPAHGKNGWVEYTFDINPAEHLWVVDDQMKVDFRKSQDVNNVKADQLLATIWPPEPGENGGDVFGRVVPARQGREVRVVAGKNVRFSEDGAQLFAQTDGYAKRIRSAIAVDKRRIVEGDVDFHTGNIEFNGDVFVVGDVKESFSVNALGSVTVEGSVDRADIRAQGDITVQGGIYGKEGISIQAEGNVLVAFAENADIRAGGNIYIRNFMVNCQACAGEFLHLKGVGKSLVGGRIRAAHGVIANSLGNPKIPTKTTIEFGLTPEMDLLVRSLTSEYQRTDENRQMEIRQQLQEIRDEYEKQLRARVVTRHVAYPGVVLITGKAKFEVRHEISRMVYYKIRDRNEISMRAFAENEKD